MLQNLAGSTLVRAFKFGNCAQTTISNDILSLAETAVGVQPGSCADAGYTVFDKNTSTYIPLYGTVSFAQYSKPSLQLQELTGCVIAAGAVVNTTLANAHTLYGCENHGSVNVGTTTMIILI